MKQLRVEGLEDRRMLAFYFVRGEDLGVTVAGQGEHNITAVIVGGQSGGGVNAAVSGGITSAELQLHEYASEDGGLAIATSSGKAFAVGTTNAIVGVPYVTTTIAASAIATTENGGPIAKAWSSPRANAVGKYKLVVSPEDERTFTFVGFAYATHDFFEDYTGSGEDGGNSTSTAAFPLDMPGGASESTILPHLNVSKQSFSFVIENNSEITLKSESDTRATEPFNVQVGYGVGTGTFLTAASSIVFGYVVPDGEDVPREYGDFDGDGDVDEVDFDILQDGLNADPDEGYLTEGKDFPWIMADGDFDGDVDSDDYDTWLNNTSTFVVSTEDDVQDTDYSYGNLSLREAIYLAGLRPGTQKITFTDEVVEAGTLTLSLGQLVIDSYVEIAGPGADQFAISGNNASRVFKVTSGVDVTLSGLTITGGKVTSSTPDSVHGAGIHNEGNLTLSHVVVTDNHALNSGRGGGLYSGIGNVDIIASTFDNNTAYLAGGARIGLASGKTSDISDSTFSNNKALGTVAGGLLVEGVTGTTSDLMTITNSTFSGNEANTFTGGIRATNSVNVTIINSTVTDNTGETEGGVSAQGGASMLIHNSILIDNHDSNVDSLNDATGNIHADSSYNIYEITNSSSLLDANGHVDGNIASTLLATKLLPLGNYGGPTMTHAVLDGSVAINAGDTTLATTTYGLTKDQRDKTRNIGQVDIGAYETGNDYTLVVSTKADESDSNYESGDLSLREVIALVDDLAGDATILFDNSLFTLGAATVLLGDENGDGDTTDMGETPTQLTIADDMTIVGPGAELLTISGGNATRVLQVNSGTEVSIEGLSIRNGNSGNTSGAGIHSSGNLSITASVISNNYAASTSGPGPYGEGGGIYQSGGSLTVVGSSVEYNSAYTGGGITITNDANFQIRDSTIAENSAFVIGGGLSIYSSTGTVLNSTISSNNVSVSAGSGVLIYGASSSHEVTFVNSTIADNDGGDSESGGAGIYHSTSSNAVVLLLNTIVAGNFDLSGNSDVYGEFDEDSSNNLIGAIDNSTGLAGGDGLIFGTAASPQDAALDELDYYGGPTRTHRLLLGSLARDVGDDEIANDYALAYDQRGQLRRAGLGSNAVDIGAFELAFEDIV